MMMKSKRARGTHGGVEDTEKPVVVEEYNQYMGVWT
jgi:hypothetical protein